MKLIGKLQKCPICRKPAKIIDTKLKSDGRYYIRCGCLVVQLKHKNIPDLVESWKQWVKMTKRMGGEGYNDALDEVVRMNPAMEIIQEGIENVIEDWLSCGENRLTPNDVKEIAQALVSQKDRWMKVKE